MSFIQPMFHFSPKPSPPLEVSLVTPGHEVDSSAMVTMPGTRLYDVALASCSSPMASRCSRPPCTLGIHSPSLRE